MFPVSFSGKICPVSPVGKVRGIADRVWHTPCLLYGFGIISGRFLTLLFVLFLTARCAVQYLLGVALGGGKLLILGFGGAVGVVGCVFLGNEGFNLRIQLGNGGQLLSRCKHL